MGHCSRSKHGGARWRRTLALRAHSSSSRSNACGSSSDHAPGAQCGVRLAAAAAVGGGVCHGPVWVYSSSLSGGRGGQAERGGVRKCCCLCRVPACGGVEAVRWCLLSNPSAHAAFSVTQWASQPGDLCASLSSASGHHTRDATASHTARWDVCDRVQALPARSSHSCGRHVALGTRQFAKVSTGPICHRV